MRAFPIPDHGADRHQLETQLDMLVNDPVFIREADLHTLGVLNAAVHLGIVCLHPELAEEAASRYEREYAPSVRRAEASESTNAFAQAEGARSNVHDHIWLGHVLAAGEEMDTETRCELQAAIPVILAEAIHQWQHARRQARSLKNLVTTSQGISLTVRLSAVAAAVAYGTAALLGGQLGESLGAGAAAAGAWVVMNPEKIREVLELVREAGGSGSEGMRRYAGSGFEHAARVEEEQTRLWQDGQRSRPITLASVRSRSGMHHQRQYSGRAR